MRNWVNFHRAGTPWIQHPDHHTEASGTPGAPWSFPPLPHLPGRNDPTLQFASMGSCRRGFAGLRPRRVLGASRQRAVGVSSFLSSSPLLRCVIYSSVLVAMGWSRSRFREVLTEGLIHNPVNAVGLTVRCVHWVRPRGMSPRRKFFLLLLLFIR